MVLSRLTRRERFGASMAPPFPEFREAGPQGESKKRSPDAGLRLVSVHPAGCGEAVVTGTQLTVWSSMDLVPPEIAMVRGFLDSGSSRLSSTWSRPFSSEAPVTSTYSASWKRSSKARSAMPRCRNSRLLSAVSGALAPLTSRLFSLLSIAMSLSAKPATAIEMR